MKNKVKYVALSQKIIILQSFKAPSEMVTIWHGQNFTNCQALDTIFHKLGSYKDVPKMSEIKKLKDIF